MAGPVLRVTPDPDWERLTVGDRAALVTRDRLAALIRAQLGQSAANFLAIPEFVDGALVGWRSASGGALRPATGAAAQRHADLLAEIGALAERLDAQGEAGKMAAHTLRCALTTPSGAQTAFVDSETPVLINWGMVASDQARPVLAGVTPPLTERSSEVGPVPDEPPAEEPEEQRRRPTLAALWGITVILALLAIGLGWYSLQPLPPKIVETMPSAPPAVDPTVGLPERLAVLETALDQATGARPRYVAVCQAPDPRCTGVAAGRIPSEVMLVLDASSSMKYSINTPASLERQILDAVKRGNFLDFDRLRRQAEAHPGRTRMSVAHEVLTDAVRSAPPGARIGISSFHDCGSIRNGGTYGPDQRDQLIRKLNGIRPTNATALAQAIRAAAGAMKGGRTPDDRVNMVIISDGLDSCNGDPCAAARAAKAARPGLVINVVDLSDFRALACVAEATGGIYRKREERMDLGDLSELVRDAAGGNALCPPARGP